MAREKKAKELKDKKEQQAKEAKEKREAELKSRQEAQARAAASAAAAAASGAAGSCASMRMSASQAGVAQAASIAPGSCNGGGSNATVGVSRSIAKQPLQSGRQDQLRDMVALRTTQRAIVYVMGLSPRIAKEEILRRHEYFGQYGKIMRIQVSPAGTAPTSGPPSLRCCITYATREEAEQAVLAVDNVVLDGRTLKASFGMPKPSNSGPTTVRQP